MKRVFAFVLSLIIIIALQCPIFASEGSKTARRYYFKRNDKNQIALTFDDGPHPRYTYKILNILKKYNIKATFFIIGVNAKNYPDALKAIADSGHEIGNHTFTHQYVKGKTRAQIVKDIKDCQETIYSICGKNTVLFRAPGGLIDEISVVSEDAFSGYDIIYWSIDTMDWAHHSAQEIANNVINNIQSGDIILMHDYIGRNSPTPEALEMIIPILLERGYEFVTVSELIN